MKMSMDKYLFAFVFPFLERNMIADKNRPVDIATAYKMLIIAI